LGSAADDRLALLVVLVGLVGEPADHGEAADLDGARRQRASRARAQHQRAEPAQRRAGGELVPGGQLPQPRNQLLGGLAGRLFNRGAGRVGGAWRLIDATCTLAHALGRLAQDLLQGLQQRAGITALRRRAFPDHAADLGPRPAAGPASEQLAQDVLQVDRSRVHAPAGDGLLAAGGARPAARPDVPPQVLDAPSCWPRARLSRGLGPPAFRLVLGPGRGLRRCAWLRALLALLAQLAQQVAERAGLGRRARLSLTGPAGTTAEQD